jgi:hypothetical protein
VQVFSSRERLSDATAAVDWFSLPGHEVLAEVPRGVGVVLDAGTEHMVPVSPADVRAGRLAQRR